MLLYQKKREWQLNKLDLATIEGEESEIVVEDDNEENKKVNDSYMKNNIVKRDQIRKPPAGVRTLNFCVLRLRELILDS